MGRPARSPYGSSVARRQTIESDARNPFALSRFRGGGGIRLPGWDGVVTGPAIAAVNAFAAGAPRIRWPWPCA